jgi:anti-sigma regulatory factor (Ser/Thr protein kinase)
MIGDPQTDPTWRSGPPTLELDLERTVDAPGIARAAVTDYSRDLGLSRSTLQTLVLLVSEVVSNAVLHSSSARNAPIMLTASVTPDAVRITVTDGGGGFTPRQRDPASINDGYGLYLVDKAASCWGVNAAGPTSVWFELPREEVAGQRR